MAITIDDFSKIWASTSPLTPYEFSESNYKEGWNFIGGTPPSRQMWDFLQKQNDEKLKYLLDNFGDYLPLAGGTMTGDVQWQYGGKTFKVGGAEADDGNHGFGFLANEGARLLVRDYDATVSAGAFQLVADDGTVNKELKGLPDGTLTWNGEKVGLQKYGVLGGFLTGTEPSLTFTIVDSIATVIVKRGDSYGMYVLTYWDSSPSVIAQSSPAPVTFTKSADSATVKITRAQSTAYKVQIFNGYMPI